MALIDTVIWTAFGVTLFIFGLTAGIILFNYMKYRRITYIIRHLRKDRVQVEIDKAKIVTTDAGQFWRTKKSKRTVPIPPDDCIDIDKKGRLFTEAYWSENGDIVYSKPGVAGFEPIHPTTVEQRLVYAQEIRRANEVGFRFFEKYGHIVTVGGIVIVLFVIVFIFWKDLIAPAQTFAATMNGVSENLAEVSERLEQIMSEEQIIRSPPPSG